MERRGTRTRTTRGETSLGRVTWVSLGPCGRKAAKRLKSPRKRKRETRTMANDRGGPAPLFEQVGALGARGGRRFSRRRESRRGVALEWKSDQPLRSRAAKKFFASRRETSGRIGVPFALASRRTWLRLRLGWELSRVHSGTMQGESPHPKRSPSRRGRGFPPVALLRRWSVRRLDPHEHEEYAVPPVVGHHVPRPRAREGPSRTVDRSSPAA